MHALRIVGSCKRIVCSARQEWIYGQSSWSHMSKQKLFNPYSSRFLCSDKIQTQPSEGSFISQQPDGINRKKSTGIAGLKVNPNARQDLIKLYEQCIRDLTLLPEPAYYRKYCEKGIGWRLQVLKENLDIEVIEYTIDNGQIEQLVESAKNQLKLIAIMAANKEIYFGKDPANPPEVPILVETRQVRGVPKPKE